jgi:hypothetical protein
VNAPGCPDSRHAKAAAMACQSWYLPQPVSSSVRTLPWRLLIWGAGTAASLRAGRHGTSSAATASANSARPNNMMPNS